MVQDFTEYKIGHTKHTLLSVRFGARMLDFLLYTEHQYEVNVH